MKCDFCGNEESLPFVCNYCGGAFCREHRLPESHACKGNLSQRPVVISSSSTYSWSGSGFGSTRPTRRRSIFSRVEIRDIIIAWFALTLAFFIAQRSFLAGVGGVLDFFIYLVTVGSGFILHELTHKFVAQRYGYRAEFRMWLFGLVFALLTSLGGIIFAAPGATYVMGGDVEPRKNGIISLAGPLVNIAIAVGFLLLLLVGAMLPSYLIVRIGGLGFWINLILAAFNMIPIPPLDGSKVWRWRKTYWAIVFVPLAVAVVVILYSPSFVI